MGNYDPTYDLNQADEALGDLGVSIVVSMVGFASLVGMVLLWRWFKKKK